MGGFTSGKKEVIEMLRQRSRPLSFSSNSLAPSIVGAASKVFDLLGSSTELRDKLETNTKYFKEGVQKAGFDLKDGDSPIVPIMLYDAKLAQQFADKLLEKEFMLLVFLPVVGKGQARIRVQISAGHSLKHLDKAIEAFNLSW